MKKYLLALCMLCCAPVCFGQLHADINGDGKVDFADFAIFAEEWLMSENNYCLTFDGLDGQIVVPHNNYLNAGDSTFFVSFWARFDALPEYGVFGLLDKLQGSPLRGFAIVIDDIGNIYTTEHGATMWKDSVFYSLNSVQCGGQSLFYDGNWHFIAIVFRDTAKNLIYVDGTKYQMDGSQNVYLGSCDSNAALNIGADHGYFGSDYSDIMADFTSGQLDDIRIYIKEPTDAEIAAIRNNNLGKKYSSADAGVAAAAWNCDEGSGNQIIDAVNGLAGSFSGGVSWMAGGRPAATAASATAQAPIFKQCSNRFGIFTQP